MNLEQAIAYVTRELVKIRTHGDVKMDGSTNPRPSERITARRIVEDIRDSTRSGELGLR